MTKLLIDKAAVEQALAAAQDFINDVHYGEWSGPGYRRNDVQDRITDALTAIAQADQPVVVSQGWTPTERELESVAEQIMRGIRSIGLWDARLGYTIRVLRDWLSASPSPAPAVPDAKPFTLPEDFVDQCAKRGMDLS